MAHRVYTPNYTRYINDTSGVNGFVPSSLAYADPTAASEYNAATVSSIVFGIFMALLTLYMIWQNGLQSKVLRRFTPFHSRTTNASENNDIDMEMGRIQIESEESSQMADVLTMPD